MSKTYKIFETDTFKKELSKIHLKSKLISKIDKRIYPQLEMNPFYGLNIKKLKNVGFDLWRYKMGPIRIFYEINKDEKIVFITTIKFRKDSYRIFIC